MDFTITAYLNQFWRDERLQLADQTVHLTMAGDFTKRIWMPGQCSIFSNNSSIIFQEIPTKKRTDRNHGNSIENRRDLIF